MGAAFVLAGLVTPRVGGRDRVRDPRRVITTWNILVMSMRQTLIPGRLLGRVHGTWRTLLWGTMPLGALVGGLLGRIDLVVPLIAGGAAAIVASVIFFRFLMTLPNPEDIDNGDHVPGEQALADEAGPTEPTVQQ